METQRRKVRFGYFRRHGLAVNIDHQDPVLTYVARGTAGGQDFEETETLSTDGKPGRDSHGGTVKSHWDSAVLVIDGTADDGGMLYAVRVSLSDDGKTITRVFTQKEDPQPRHETYDKQ